MTKTPEELTKDWKEGKLKSGLYWVKFKGKIVIAECTVFGIDVFTFHFLLHFFR